MPTFLTKPKLTLPSFIVYKKCINLIDHQDLMNQLQTIKLCFRDH